MCAAAVCILVHLVLANGKNDVGETAFVAFTELLAERRVTMMKYLVEYFRVGISPIFG